MKLGLSGLLLACTGLSVALIACGDEEEEKPKDGEVGTECDADQADSCEDGLECSAAGSGFKCSFPTGEACEPDNDDLDNGGCAETDVCAGGTGDAGADESICRVRKGEECDPAEPYCEGELVCAEIDNGERRCFEPLIFRGQVTDSSDASAIEGAHVISIDDEGVAASDIALSDEAGNYELNVPIVREEDGSPVETSFTLRSSAQDYQTFPSGIRVALPISTTEASHDEDRYVIESALTDISLIPLEAGDRTSISGKIEPLSVGDGGVVNEVGGVLIVATGPEGSFSAVSDKSGNFTIFNVPVDGDYEIKAYAADIQIEEESVSVGDEPIEDVVLDELDERTTTLSGTVQIVNAPGDAMTSVILVVADTFDPNAVRGEAPRGLRAPRTGEPNVTGEFEITGVPAGQYYVLAAYENDFLVLDPDTNISGTDFVQVSIAAGEADATLPESFKITEALAVESPGADLPEAVTQKPTLVWADDSSEDWYEVRVYDAFGNEVWSNDMVPGVSGSETVSLQYEGPLDPGMYYQFRVSSWRQPGKGDAAPISRTEDLRGVFFAPAEGAGDADAGAK